MSNAKRPVSLEDLLRLKRAERPPAEFWHEFDRQLRAKQLAALVHKRPWWDGIRSAFYGLGRVHVALGATAALTIAFVALRKDSPVIQPAPASGAEVAAVSTAPAAKSERIAVANTVAAVDSATAITSTAPTFVAMADPAPQPDGPGLPVAASEISSEVSPVQALTASTFEAEQATPSARFIAANYAAVQDSVGSALLADAQGFEVRSVATKFAKVEPLQQMTPPGEPRRSARLLTAMVSVSPNDASFTTTERVANQISPEELYDRVRRIGTRHGGLNVKF